MDELAHRLGTDPLEFRLRHLCDGRLADVFRAAAERLGWRAPQTSPHTLPNAGPGDGAGIRVGVGIAGGIEKGGRVATAAAVRVEADGTLHVDQLVTAFDCCALVNPANLANQIQSAAITGPDVALFEASA